MKLKLPASRFLRLAKQAVQFAGRGREISSGLSLVHVQVTDKGALRLSAHDAVAGARVSCQADESEPGAVTLVGDQLDRMTSILPAQGSVSLETLSGARLRVRAGRMVMDVPSRPEDAFMPLPRPPRIAWSPVDDQALVDVIEKTLWAMCRDDRRPILAGVHLTSDWSETTDGRMMSNLRPGILRPGQDVVVPGDSWTRFRALVGDGDPLHMCVEPNRVWFRSRTWACYSTLLCGAFPDTRSLVFDVDGDGFHDGETRVHWIKVNRHETLAVVKRIVGASVSQEEKSTGAAVTFHLRDDGDLHFVSHYSVDDVSNSIIVDELVDWADGNVSVDNPGGFQWLRGIGIYGQYMAWALASLSSDVIKMMWADGGDIGGMPMQFQEPGRTALVMPRRL